MTARFMVCDVFDGIATLEDGSVDLVVTSPPFLALRSYLPADHPDKAKEMGSEATPGAFLDRLLDVVEALTPKLAAHASIVFELGDTYAGSGGAGGDYNEGGLRDGAPGFDGSMKHARLHDPSKGPPIQDKDYKHRGVISGKGWPLDKSKVLIPQLFAIALAYGFNPLTGRTTEPWRVRNTVAWCRPNPPVGRDGDKFRPATSFLTVACKGRDRYWDGDAVRVPLADSPGNRYPRPPSDHARNTGKGKGYGDAPIAPVDYSAGAPLLDYWVIPTAPYKGSHYATFPPDLVVPLVKSMCPRRVCRECGKPSTRIVETTQLHNGKVREDDHALYTTSRGEDQPRGEFGPMPEYVQVGGAPSFSTRTETLGWSDCGCPGGEERYRPGLVCDPFAGSGTTLSVASGHGYDAVGFDLDPRNADLARERVGMFLEVEAQPVAGGPVPEPRIR